MPVWFWLCSASIGLLILVGIVAVWLRGPPKPLGPNLVVYVDGEEVPSSVLNFNLTTGTVSFRDGYRPKKGARVSIQYTMSERADGARERR